MSDSPERPNLFFRLTTLAGAAFVVTILSLVAALFGDPQAPPARFLNAHGTTVIGWEVAVILFLGLLAMTVDRRQILRQVQPGKQAGSQDSSADTSGRDSASADAEPRHRPGETT